MADFTVRVAMPADLESIVNLSEQSSERSRTGVLRRIGSGGTRIAVRGGSIVGYSVTERSFFGNHFIEMLWVDKDARRCGVASMLLDAVSAEHSTEKVFTSTNLSNSPMQAVLTRLGWESMGIVYGLDEGDPELFYKAPPR